MATADGTPPRYVFDFGDDPVPPATHGRLDAPAFHRNRQPIFDVLAPLLGDGPGDVLEIGSGSGQHLAAYAAALPHITWWPSDPAPLHRRSIDAWRQASSVANLEPVIDLDAGADDWGLGRPGRPPAGNLAAILAINVVHIAPSPVSTGLIAGTARHLRPGGHLLIYGPFARAGRHTAASNAGFDAALRAANRDWGVRDADALMELARQHGLTPADIVAMPSNNLTLVIRRD